MQLPRGKFRSLIKGVALNSLIQELAEVRYTGHINISWNREVISLVIQKGRYILAEYGALRGNPAWEGTLALGEKTIDAVLSDFSEPELKLAIEFNEPWMLSPQAVPRPARGPREREKEPAPREKAPEPVREPAPAKQVREMPIIPSPPHPPVPPPPPTGEKEAGDMHQAEIPVPPQAWTKVDMTQAIAVASGKAGSGLSPHDGYDELALLRMEMLALDDVDVEHIATKIRKNAKGIVKKLHLGHLMTEKED